MTDAVLTVRDVVYRYGAHTVLSGVTFDVRRGETFAIAGRSGCGKSTLARIVAGLLRPSSGQIALSGRRQMVFQDPGSSLNPTMRLRVSLSEPTSIQRGRQLSPAEIGELLERVGVPASAADRYPHQLSGGERQRVAMARAISTRPDLIICDEPTSALDPTTQAQVVNLLSRLQRELGMACLLVSHDLALISQLAGRIGILFEGKICESGDTLSVLRSPGHAHTTALCEPAR